MNDYTVNLTVHTITPFCSSAPFVFVYIDALIISSTNYALGDASTRIWLTELDCAGNELSILNCVDIVGINYCTHSEDVGIRCFGEFIS